MNYENVSINDIGGAVVVHGGTNPPKPLCEGANVQSLINLDVRGTRTPGIDAGRSDDRSSYGK